MYDAIIVGARVAGAPTAMLLARQGSRVLLLDRSSFPSDTISTHYLQTAAVAALGRWGVLDDLLASGCPPFRRTTLDFGFTSVSRAAESIAGVDFNLCPRRTVLDDLLVQAAVSAGAELRERFTVQDLLWEDGRVVGIRGRTAAGGTVAERARVVIGADGAHSLVARAVDAPRYHERPAYNFGYYSYFSGIPLDGADLSFREGQVLFFFPTHDGQTCVAMEATKEGFHEFRTDIEANFYHAFERVPAAGERLRAGRREERFTGTVETGNVYRRPYGPGWALVGDAGYHKDPLMGWGIADAFRDAELLADALHAGFCAGSAHSSSGRDGEAARTMARALAGYEQARNRATLPVYMMTIRLAQLPEPTAATLQAFGLPVGV